VALAARKLALATAPLSVAVVLSGFRPSSARRRFVSSALHEISPPSSFTVAAALPMLLLLLLLPLPAPTLRGFKPNSARIRFVSAMLHEISPFFSVVCALTDFSTRALGASRRLSGLGERPRFSRRPPDELLL
jgi:hypothetical protein